MDLKGAQFPGKQAWPDDGETTPILGSADIVLTAN